MKRGYDANIKHVARSNVKDTVGTNTLCIGFNEICLVQPTTLSGMVGFENNLAQNDHYDKMMCCDQEPCH